MNNQYANDLSAKAKMYCWMLRAQDPPAFTQQIADLLMELAEEVDLLDEMNRSKCKLIRKYEKKIEKRRKKLESKEESK